MRPVVPEYFRMSHVPQGSSARYRLPTFSKPRMPSSSASRRFTSLTAASSRRSAPMSAARRAAVCTGNEGSKRSRSVPCPGSCPYVCGREGCWHAALTGRQLLLCSPLRHLGMQQQSWHRLWLPAGQACRPVAPPPQQLQLRRRWRPVAQLPGHAPSGPLPAPPAAA